MSDSANSKRNTSTEQQRGEASSLFRSNPTAVFFVLTFALTWGWWAVAYLAPASGELSDALALPGAFGPLVAGAIVTFAVGDNLRAWATQVLDWRISPRWYLVAIGLPLLITVGGVGTVLLVAGAAIDPSLLAQRLPIFPVVLLVMLLLGGGQEELGWRGFALPRLQADYSALVASLLVGGAWALWHLPLFFMGAPRNQTGNFLLYALLIIGFSVVLTWCYNSTGSVLLAMILHASMNSSGALLPIQSGVANQWAMVIDGASVIAMWLVAVAVIVWGSADALSRDGIPELSLAGVERPER